MKRDLEVLAPCGCWVAVDHTQGDRRVICDHGRRWAVRAIQQPVTYRFDEQVAW